MEQVASRRAVIAGASMAVGAIAAVAWWPRGARLVGTGDAVTVVPGGEAPPLAVGVQAQAIDALVGQSVRIAGEAGAAVATIAAVQLLSVRGARPAGVRAQPFAITFLTDRIGAPAGSAIYPVGVAIDGLDRLFLLRGADIGDKATLLAFFT